MTSPSPDSESMPSFSDLAAFVLVFPPDDEDTRATSVKYCPRGYRMYENCANHGRRFKMAEFRLQFRKKFLGERKFPYDSDREYFESKEFQSLPTKDILEMYQWYFHGSIYLMGDTLNPESDEDARRTAIRCLIDGRPRKTGYDNLPPDAVA